MNISAFEYYNTILGRRANFNGGAMFDYPKLPLFLFTGNKDKIEEFNHFFDKTNFYFFGTGSLNGELKAQATAENPEENGETLVENSIIKSAFGHKISRIATVADDTGFFVDALNGEPGVRAGRYAGETCDYEANRLLVLKNLEGIDEAERTAAFRCVITLFFPGIEKPFEFTGECRGRITHEKRPGNQFGYDPIFVPEGYDKAFSEMELELKNKISHRGRAFQLLLDFLETTVK